MRQLRDLYSTRSRVQWARRRNPLPNCADLSGTRLGRHGIAATRVPNGAEPEHSNRFSARRCPAVSEPALVRLTSNPADMSVTSAHISPDGWHLAFADATGLQVRIIDSDKTHRLAETKGMNVSLDPGFDGCASEPLRRAPVFRLGHLSRRAGTSSHRCRVVP
jgi:hypothetical protein